LQVSGALFPIDKRFDGLDHSNVLSWQMLLWIKLFVRGNRDVS